MMYIINKGSKTEKSRPILPGFKKPLIEPFLPESMNNFICNYNSVNGTISVSVSKDDVILRVEITYPADMEVEVKLHYLDAYAKNKDLRLSVKASPYD